MKPSKRILPHESNSIFLTDGGLETTLIFENGHDLPEFAAFTLLNQKQGYGLLRDYYLPYIRVAQENGTGFLLESATYRASRAWGEKLGFDANDLRIVNQAAISILKELRNEFETESLKMVISGCIGPKGDGYRVDDTMTIKEAVEYHSEQILALKEAKVDLVSAYTMNYFNEAAGVVLAAKEIGIPVVISFTTEVDGRLPSGQDLGEAIEMIDRLSDNYPAYFMINCAHPTHFKNTLQKGGKWVDRVRAIRANASSLSHSELDEMEELDSGDIAEFGQLYQELSHKFPKLNVFGGCCGTNHHHIDELAHRCNR